MKTLTVNPDPHNAAGGRPLGALVVWLMHAFLQGIPTLAVAMNEFHSEIVFKHLVKRVLAAMLQPTTQQSVPLSRPRRAAVRLLPLPPAPAARRRGRPACTVDEVCAAEAEKHVLSTI